LASERFANADLLGIGYQLGHSLEEVHYIFVDDFEWNKAYSCSAADIAEPCSADNEGFHLPAGIDFPSTDSVGTDNSAFDKAACTVRSIVDENFVEDIERKSYLPAEDNGFAVGVGKHCLVVESTFGKQELVAVGDLAGNAVAVVEVEEEELELQPQQEVSLVQALQLQWSLV